MMKWMDRLLDRICVLLGALLFLQAPQFLDHYTQRLGGHAAELQKQVALLHQTAEKGGKTLPEMVGAFSTNPDPIYRSHADYLGGMITRAKSLGLAHRQLAAASPFTRPFLLVRHFYPEVAQGAIAGFHPGIPLSLEGVCWGVFGMFAGFFIFWLLKKLGKLRTLFRSSR